MTTIFQAKWWIASRTLAFNVIVLSFEIVAQFVPVLEQYAPSPQILLSVVAAVNIGLRVLTQIKLTAK